MDQPNNPHWPPSQYPSSAGAAHGLHMNEREGSGIGRCIVVLMGGRSGGHQAAVLGAVRRLGRYIGFRLNNTLLGIPCQPTPHRYLWCAFFFILSKVLIGSQSMSFKVDRCVKIWAVRPASDNRVLTREDKPVFSSSRIHKARVTSVTWYDIHSLSTM